MASPETEPLVPDGGVEAALLQGEMLTVQREQGRTVFLRNNIYTRTNFYIQQSRPYFTAPLTTYINIYWHQWTFLVYFFVGFLTPLDPVFALVWFLCGIPYFLLYLQHMYVNIFTMPLVLSQPSLPDSKLNRANAFFIISYASYQASYLAVFGENQRASMRHLEAEGGRVKVQAFRRSAMRQMKMCLVVSTLAFFGSIWTMDYCLAWFIVRIGTAYSD